MAGGGQSVVVTGDGRVCGTAGLTTCPASQDRSLQKCVMLCRMKVSAGRMLVNLRLSPVIILLNIVARINSLNLTAIEVPKYAKVDITVCLY